MITENWRKELGPLPQPLIDLMRDIMPIILLSNSSIKHHQIFHLDGFISNSFRDTHCQIILHQIYRVLLQAHPTRDGSPHDICITVVSPVSGALSPVDADLIPSPKRVKDSGYFGPKDREIDARVVVEAIDRDETETSVRGPVEVRVERVFHNLLMQRTFLSLCSGGSSRGYIEH
ncbi:hypothetical protein Tco_1295246 [Tanacetum coccineum]